MAYSRGSEEAEEDECPETCMLSVEVDVGFTKCRNAWFREGLLGDIWQFYFRGTSAYPFWTYDTELLPRAHFQSKHSCLSFKKQNNPGIMGHKYL